MLRAFCSGHGKAYALAVNSAEKRACKAAMELWEQALHEMGPVIQNCFAAADDSAAEAGFEELQSRCATWAQKIRAETE